MFLTGKSRPKGGAGKKVPPEGRGEIPRMADKS